MSATARRQRHHDRPVPARDHPQPPDHDVPRDGHRDDADELLADVQRGARLLVRRLRPRARDGRPGAVRAGADRRHGARRADGDRRDRHRATCSRATSSSRTTRTVATATCRSSWSSSRTSGTGEIFAYTANIAHMTDIGGMVPAAFGDHENMFQEGIRFPPVKIYRRDREVEAIFRILISNVRTPKHSLRRHEGDDRLAVPGRAPHRRARHALRRRHVRAVLRGHQGGVREAHARPRSRAWPDGEYTAEGLLEDDGVVPDRPLEHQGHAGHPRRRADRRLHRLRPAVLRAGEPDVRHHRVARPTTPCCTWSPATSRTTTAAYRAISVIAPPGQLRQRQLPGVHASAATPTRSRRRSTSLLEGVLRILGALIGRRRRHLRLHRLRRRGPADARAVRPPAPRGRGLGRARRRRRQRRAVRQERQLRQHAGRGRRDALPVPQHGVPAGARARSASVATAAASGRGACSAS